MSVNVSQVRKGFPWFSGYTRVNAGQSWIIHFYACENYHRHKYTFFRTSLWIRILFDKHGIQGDCKSSMWSAEIAKKKRGKNKPQLALALIEFSKLSLTLCYFLARSERRSPQVIYQLLSLNMCVCVQIGVYVCVFEAIQPPFSLKMLILVLTTDRSHITCGTHQ